MTPAEAQEFIRELILDSETHAEQIDQESLPAIALVDLARCARLPSNYPGCPAPEQVERFARYLMPMDIAVFAAAHVARCPACEQKVIQIAKEQQQEIEARGQALLQQALENSQESGKTPGAEAAGQLLQLPLQPKQLSVPEGLFREAAATDTGARQEVVQTIDLESPEGFHGYISIQLQVGRRIRLILTEAEGEVCNIVRLNEETCQRSVLEGQWEGEALARVDTSKAQDWSKANQVTLEMTDGKKISIPFFLSPRRTRRVIVRGVVQGVHYRQFLSQHAKRLGILGYARNLEKTDAQEKYDSVEVMFQGDAESVDEFFSLVKKGPQDDAGSADVKEVKDQKIPEGAYEQLGPFAVK